MHSMGVGSAGVLLSSIVIKCLTNVGCSYVSPSQAVSPCPATVRFYNVRFVIPTFCLTLPNSVRVEKFGITRVRCQAVHALTQIIIRVCTKLQAYFLQTAYRFVSASPCRPCMSLCIRSPCDLRSI